MTLFELIAVVWMVATVGLLVGIGQALSAIRSELDQIKQKAAPR
jgi:hypothetical protein